MPLSLSVAAATGDLIDATVLRAHADAIEAYVNEGIVGADLATGWVTSVHLFGATFHGGANPHTRAETGTVVHRFTGADSSERTIHHHQAGTSYVTIQGLGASFSVPQDLNVGGPPAYRVRVVASLHVFEYGGRGAAGSVDNSTNLAAFVALHADGSVQNRTRRSVFSASDANVLGAIYARQNHSMLATLAASTLTAGPHSVDVRISVNVPPTAAPNAEWQHLLIGPRNLRASWYWR